MFYNHETRETSHGTLSTCIKHQGSRIGKLINKLTNSPINSQNAPLHLLRELYKSTLFMQNEPNLYHGLGARVSLLSVCNITRYVNVRPVGLPENCPKNEPKRTQNEPNSYHGHPVRGSSISACNITRYVNVRPVGLAENEPKNEAKQSQFKPNFRPKLGSFFTSNGYKSWELNEPAGEIRNDYGDKYCGERADYLCELKTIGEEE